MVEKYISCKDAIDAVRACCLDASACNLQCIKDIPAADVLPRDEAIKMGAELAAMHGSDATSQQLEEAYLKGVEYGMTRRDVRPVVLCKDCRHRNPEDHKCDCGGTERQGCPFRVHDNYFCAYGEKRAE